MQTCPRRDRVALHPSIRALLDAMPPSKPSDIPLSELRELVNTRIRLAPKLNAPVASVENRRIPGPSGEIGVRIYTPRGSGPFRVTVFFHGGGWVAGNLDTHDDLCRSLSHLASSVVVSVDYALAPEHRFPAPLEDCYAAVEWVAAHAASIAGKAADGEAARISVAGDSAGGNLAAAVALLTRDRGGPRLARQVLLYPITNCNFETVSYHQNAAGFGLTRATMQFYWDRYISSPHDAGNPYASPLLACTLEGLAPALIITAEYDPLRDDGLAYAARLAASGVPVECTNYLDMNHGFFAFSAGLDSAQKALEEVAAAL